MKHAPAYLVVIGTSAGGFSALNELVQQLSPDTDAAYCIILHLSYSSNTGSFLINHLQPFTSLPCQVAEEGMLIEKGHIYIAQPGKHLIVKEGKLLLGHGPEENTFRPSIDVLFRSAAVEYNCHCIGIILTGLLNDGTSGMEAISHCGGTLIIQDPAEAEFPSMPQSVLSNMAVDYTLPLQGMGEIIAKLASTNEVREAAIPPAVIIEVKRSEKMAVGIAGMDELGAISPYGCPDCGGNLWKMKDDGNGGRYRCHIGHAYSEDTLLHKQAEGIEAGLWTAIRMMEERKHLLVTKAEEYTGRRLSKIANSYNHKAEDLKAHIEQLKGLLLVVETNQSSILNPQ